MGKRTWSWIKIWPYGTSWLLLHCPITEGGKTKGNSISWRTTTQSNLLALDQKAKPNRTSSWEAMATFAGLAAQPPPLPELLPAGTSQREGRLWAAPRFRGHVGTRRSTRCLVLCNRPTPAIPAAKHSGSNTGKSQRRKTEEHLR